jgi:hypothetical protein
MLRQDSFTKAIRRLLQGGKGGAFRLVAVYYSAFMTNNAGSSRKRINQRLVSAPANAVLTSAWLKEHGIIMVAIPSAALGGAGL